MKIWLTVCCLALAAFSGAAEADRGHGHHRHGGRHGGGSIGLWIGAPIVIGGPYAYPYAPYPYYRYGPPVVREYVYERPAPPPVVVAPQSPTWYYCRESGGYYPYVRECPGGWDSVPARPPAEDRP